MTDTISTSTLAEIASHVGPCLTLTVPDYHRGAAESSRRATLRTLVRGAREKVVATSAAAWPAGFEMALDQLAETLPETGGPGLAVYRTPDWIDTYPLQGESSKSVLASHPHVMPLLTAAFSAHDLFVLGLSTKQVRLFECVNGVCAPLPLPAGVPASLEAAGHARHGAPAENRTAVGHSVGAMAGMQFGTAGQRESARSTVEHFFAALDHGIQPLLQHRPLLLMGVKEEIAAFRRVSHYPSLLHSEVEGNTDAFTPARIVELARGVAREEYQRQGEVVLAECREMPNRARTAHDPREVLKAAAEGRVHQLCVRDETELMGPMQADLDRAHLPAEDLINAAVVETLRHRGAVYLLPATSMPVTESLCAVLRHA